MKAFLGFLLAIVIIGLVVGLFVFESWLLMLLINWLVPIFFPSFIGLSLGQACGLNLIASILFGGGGITIKSRKD
jgi:hypothetical protein